MSDASLYTFAATYSPVRNSQHQFQLDVAPGWLDSNPTQTLVFPDFSQVPGFNSAWVAPSDGSVALKAMVVVTKSDANGTLRTESMRSATFPLD